MSVEFAANADAHTIKRGAIRAAARNPDERQFLAGADTHKSIPNTVRAFEIIAGSKHFDWRQVLAVAMCSAR